MVVQAAGLAHLDQCVPESPPLPNGSDARVQALFHSVGLLHVPVAPAPRVQDNLGEDVYHAMLITCLSKWASPAPSGSSSSAEQQQHH